MLSFFSHNILSCLGHVVLEHFFHVTFCEITQKNLVHFGEKSLKKILKILEISQKTSKILKILKISKYLYKNLKSLKNL